MIRMLASWGAAVLTVLMSCSPSQQEVRQRILEESTCRGSPAFLSKFGVEPHQVAFSTSERTKRGLVLRENSPQRPGLPVRKWQHPSWSLYGWLGSISIARDGSIFVVPTPVVNTLYNPPELQTVLYRVDTASGEMKSHANLPRGGPPTDQNPYGLVGVFVDCTNNVVYVSSVAGSTREKEVGKIIAISETSGIILDTLNDQDAIGLAASSISGSKKLYFGSARSNEVFSVSLDSFGRFSGKPVREFSLTRTGVSIDERARRIRVSPEGTMEISSIDFRYNLTAPTEKRESLYSFRYDLQSKAWSGSVLESTDSEQQKDRF